jgi:hypothetical protein
LTKRERLQKKTPLGFELWDNESGNLMGDYDSEAEAFAALNAAIEEYGPSYADSVALLCIFPSGPDRIADGAELVIRAREAAAAAASSAAVDSPPLGSREALLNSPKRRA